MLVCHNWLCLVFYCWAKVFIDGAIIGRGELQLTKWNAVLVVSGSNVVGNEVVQPLVYVSGGLTALDSILTLIFYFTSLEWIFEGAFLYFSFIINIVDNLNFKTGCRRRRTNIICHLSCLDVSREQFFWDDGLRASGKIFILILFNRGCWAKITIQVY